MCDTCGCGRDHVHTTIEVDAELLGAHSESARHNREHFISRKLFAINLMGTPGAGKTALLEATIRNWRKSSLAVVEGDQATERDSARIRAAGAAAFQVETGLGCHLDANQVHRALHHLELASGALLFIENVGNLVCPALFDLGEQLKIVVTSPTEGTDKPLKYPPMFRAADIVVLNKCDLLPHVPFEIDQWTEYVMAVNPRAKILNISALDGSGLDSWIAEIDLRRADFLAEA
jgi:hydrogenase nickel incorporation protein HypB